QTGDVLRYGFQEKDGLLRIAWREVRQAKVRKRPRKITYGEFKDQDSFFLPTVATFTDPEGGTIAFRLAYDEVERRTERVGDFTEKEVRAAIRAFKKGWRKWDGERRVLELRKLARYDHKLVSAVIAKEGLKDKDHAVRKEAVKRLGALGRKNATPDLIRLYKATATFEIVKKEQKDRKKMLDREIHLEVIEALGKIGDPRAIPLFAEGWGNMPEPSKTSFEIDYLPARKKLNALGRIRHKESVETVLDVWAKGGLHVGTLITEITGSLRKLTGQDFDKDMYAWKNWWNKNKATFRFK
ncbi:MAG: HEAT repeat domain-containing protein, partial [Planctomycetota bacterium]